MKYRYDPDLEFLSQIKSEHLNGLLYCLTHNRYGYERLTEELISDDLYKKYYPDHQKYWKLIAAELQCFGANSFVTMLRGGEGVLYKEVLIDVCDKMKVNYNKDSRVETIEGNLLMKILADAIEKMRPEELKELAETTGIKNTNGITPQVMIGAFQAVFRAGGFKSYQITQIVVNAVLEKLIYRRRPIFLKRPFIAWAIVMVWTAIDIAGVKYRTIPAVIQVAALRQKYLYEKQAGEISFG